MWVARDYCGTLFVYKEKPRKSEDVWLSNGYYMMIDSDLFPEVKWEDDEPRELVLKPINKE